MKGAIQLRLRRRWEMVVSIRAPREGGDYGRPARADRGGVSIRAPREGGDEGVPLLFGLILCFNPRPP